MINLTTDRGAGLEHASRTAQLTEADDRSELALGSTKIRGLTHLGQLLLTTAPLLAADLAALGCSLVVAWQVAGASDFGPLSQLDIVVLTVIPAPFLATLLGMYPGVGSGAVAELRRTTWLAGCSCGLMLLPVLLYQRDFWPVAACLAGGMTALTALPLCRWIARSICSRFSWWGQPVIILGGSEIALRLYRYYLKHPRLGFRPVQIVDDWSVDGLTDGLADGGSAMAHRIESLHDCRKVFWVLVAAPFVPDSAAMIRRLLATFPDVALIPGGERVPYQRNQLVEAAGFTAVHFTNRLLLPHNRLVKWLMDFALVGTVGMIALPVMAIIAILVKATSAGPVLYAQNRIRNNNRLFKAWKFRTMHMNADELHRRYLDANPQLRKEWERNHKLKNDPRVTPLGEFLRKTSLDELPQLWNIVRGEMSMVGPRPIVVAEKTKYGSVLELYLRATPGITGLWQVSGRNNTTYEERIELDAQYVLNWSPWLDLYILFRTIKVVLLREGAY